MQKYACSCLKYFTTCLLLSPCCPTGSTRRCYHLSRSVTSFSFSPLNSGSFFPLSCRLFVGLPLFSSLGLAIPQLFSGLSLLAVRTHGSEAGQLSLSLLFSQPPLVVICFIFPQRDVQRPSYYPNLSSHGESVSFLITSSTMINSIGLILGAILFLF